MREELPSILFVEDESEVRFELKRFLQRYSREVITASNGEEGLRLFKLHTPDIVISDIKMPKMSGIDMAKKIKNYSPKQVIIFTTAHSDSRYFLDAIEMQADAYILKPVDLGLLKQKINEITKGIKLEKEKKLYESIVDDVAQMQDSMLAVYDEENRAIFYNKKLLTFIGYKGLEYFLKKYKSLSSLFETNKGCYYPEKNYEIHWVEEMKSIREDKRIVSIRPKNGNESYFFFVTISEKTQNNHTIVTFSEITAIVKKKRQYEYDAHTDELTKIGNRTKFNVIFDTALKRHKKNQNNQSIILLDIDNFKEINDRFGHIVGDNVLKLFATLILKHIRSIDSFSRWGGEEFVLLLSDVTLDNAKMIAENLRKIIEAYDFGIDKKLTCSFGVSSAHYNDTKESLFGRVDKALYKAKNNGKNQVEVCQ